MICVRPVVCRLLIAAALGAVPVGASAQLGPGSVGSRFQLDAEVQVPRVVGEVRGQLDRIDALLADRQWEEAIDSLLSVLAANDDRLAPVTPHRFVGLPEYGRLRLAHLPPEALQLYRNRVDPIARRWFEEGQASRDDRLLRKVVDEAFASSWGDKALFLLGDMALEQGDFATARFCWERILPIEASEASATWLRFPDSRLDLAAVRARLILTTILEGSPDRAKEELALFRRLHPESRGWFGGREVDFAAELADLITASRHWPHGRPPRSWPTFAGSLARNTVAKMVEDVAAVAWRHPLPESGPRVAATLAYHPVWEGPAVFVSSHREIHGFQLANGEPAWRGAGRAVFREQLEGVTDPGPVPADTLGSPQFTLTADNRRLLGRMGSSVTMEPLERDGSVRRSYLVCLDLRAEGRLLWQVSAEDGWAFEGAPASDGTNAYVGMRRSDVRPQAHLAAFDVQTGRRRWQRFLCAADTPARGLMAQASHNLVTVAGGTLYYNTNLGAVAAVSADDGRVRWLSLYPRARSGDSLNLAPHWRREANPCVYHRGMLLVAPSDSPRVFALDAATGQMLWQSGPETEGILHLLGTTDDHLIAAGDRLYWIVLDGPKGGRVEHLWPDGPDQPGLGRGVLAGPYVLWPTQSAIRVFDQRTAQPVGAIDLVPLRAAGGNLLAAGDRLLVATSTELIALAARPGREQDTEPPPVASRLPDAGRPLPH